MTSARSSDLMDEAKRIIEDGEKEGITLRLMGGCAIRAHCSKFRYLLDGMKRELPDIDIMSYSKLSPHVKRFFTKLGYTPDEEVLAYYAFFKGGRHIYYDKERKITVDVLFDTLSMCHEIDFRGRLELDYPTISLADILLHKMQIVELNKRDVIDTIVLLREHNVGEKDKEVINAKYIGSILSKDWGFYHTVTTNLSEVKKFLGQYDILTTEDCSDINNKIDELLVELEKEPKTLKWRMREKIGTRMKWYQEVEEVKR